MRNESDQQASLLFFHDNVHPNGPTGHRALAEIAWQLMEDVLRWGLGQ
jgi:hypothetical protein